MISYEPVRGMKDYYGEELYKIKVVENAFLKIVKLAGYQEVETPIVEDFQLFALKGGEELRNTMYVFKDKAGREVALRPEFTPSIVRFYLNSLQHLPKPIRLYYLGTVYRYDEPQFGRYREFRQAGIELLGSSNIYSDLEILQILIEIYRELNLINKIRLKINNISLIRKILNKLNISDNLQEHFLHLIDKGKIDEALSLLPNSEYTELITNILSVSNLDISNYNKIKEDLTEKYNLKDLIQDLDRIMLLKNILDNLGVNSYIDLGFVRGLAYYTGLIFEVLHPSVSFSIAGGGRYDNLVELYGGTQTPAIGFAIGVERTALVLEEPNIVKEKQNKIGVIILSDEAILYAIRIVDKLRSNNYIATINLKSISISKLIPSYAEEGYSFLIFIGKKEYEDKTITLKNLSTKEQVTIKEENLLDYLKQII
ncbi:histidine--tRNA ligase [Sulfurisphaera ohwakuensis]|uniref:Histidine--tRNA ligase n=1 Tax=Sulfurisphaera ohwakuensis TaxID=69656 RepID=A0A650CDV7_SULOH|nr:histidine--tRNA ligase [Sulfurisphaera ohwakuensis]MBB5253123.1 histidyl-tRNA synthetase [Sulfurisphaera ohwakuensis]QGR15959.1 histidine--tRNA ligase [Sulfurisphaera ohwakuensis]